jgi:C_GCAxxG_C_C family probable redox protein
MHQESIPEIRKSAEDLFASGLFCAEAVVAAIGKAQGVDPAPLQKAATAFCSGMARTSSTCGALTGAVMGVSLALGRSGPKESVQPVYSATQRLIREFEHEFGSTNCQALLSGCDLNTLEGQAQFKEQRLGHRCHRFTGAAAEMAARIIADSDG